MRYLCNVEGTLKHKHTRNLISAALTISPPTRHLQGCDGGLSTGYCFSVLTKDDDYYQVGRKPTSASMRSAETKYTRENNPSFMLRLLCPRYKDQGFCARWQSPAAGNNSVSADNRTPVTLPTEQFHGPIESRANFTFTR